MKATINIYGVLQELWEGVCDTEIIARVRGVAAQMETFDVFWGLEKFFSGILTKVIAKKRHFC